MTDSEQLLEAKATAFLRDNESGACRLLVNFARTLDLGGAEVCEALRSENAALQSTVASLEARVAEAARESRAADERIRAAVAEAERRATAQATQHVASQMQAQYERASQERDRAREELLGTRGSADRLRAELDARNDEIARMREALVEAEAARSRKAIESVQSNMVGASQEEVLATELMTLFPFGSVSDVSRSPHHMDLALALPVSGENDCVIAIESKSRKTANVDSKEIAKFERDFCEMGEAADGAVLVARRRVDVVGGRSEVVAHNLRRASPSTFYVDNCDTEALARACILIYARRLVGSPAAPSDGTTLVVPSGGVGRVIDGLSLEMVNETMRQVAVYIQRQNGLIADFYAPLRSHYVHHNVAADPLAASLVNLRGVLDGVQTEQVIQSLNLRGSGVTIKKKVSGGDKKRKRLTTTSSSS